MIDVSKTAGLYFTKRLEKQPDPDVFIYGEKIPLITQFKYLGILFQTSC